MQIPKVLSICPRREQRDATGYLPKDSMAFAHHFRNIHHSSRIHLTGDIRLHLGLHVHRKIILWMSSIRTWSPINRYNLPPQKNSTRGVHFVVSANVYRDKIQWCLYPNTSERTAMQPPEEAFSTPRYTASATSSISLTLHDAGTWEQRHFPQNCVVCLHDVEEKHCTGIRGLTPPLTSCVTSSKAVKAQSPHPLNEGIGLDGFLIPFQFLQ